VVPFVARHPVRAGYEKGMHAMNLWEVMLSIFWFMLLVAWISLLIRIFADIFRADDLSGIAKAGWSLFVIVLPWIGVLTYLLVRGRSMGERAMRDQEAYGRQMANMYRQPSLAEELGRLTELRDQGKITQEEYELAKQQALGAGAAAPSAPAAPPAQARTGAADDRPLTPMS
jgi:hypothetical protein